MYRRLLCASLALWLAACGGTASSSPTPTATTAAPTAAARPTAPGKAELTKIVVAKSGTDDFTSVNQNYFYDQLRSKGFTVEVQNLATADTTLRTVVQGSADLFVGSLGTVARLAESGGGGMKVIANDVKATDYLLLSQKAIANVAGLKDHTIGINSPGDAGDTVARACLAGSNFDVTTAKFVQIGGTSARVAALLANKIDAAPAHVAEGLTALTKTDALKVLVACSDPIGPFLQATLAAADPWLAKNPNTAQIVVDTWIDAVRWAAKNKTEYLALSKKTVPDVDDKIRSDSYDLFIKIGYFATNGGMSTDLLDRWDKLAVTTRAVTSAVPPRAQWVEQKYVNSYLARFGTVAE